MQDLLLAQNDIALRIASSISTSNCDPTAMAAVRTFAAAAATPAPWLDVVARFGPEWNSLGMNKTRSFNILGAFMTPDAQYCCIRSGAANPATATLQAKR